MTQKPKIVPAVDDPAKSEETIGKISLDLQSKGTMDTDAIELQREIHKGSNSEKSFDEEVWAAVDRGRKDSNIDGIFYVVVLFKKERALQNIIRQYFFYRQSCPTPEFDQTVYCYRPKTDSLSSCGRFPITLHATTYLKFVMIFQKSSKH